MCERVLMVFKQWLTPFWVHYYYILLFLSIMGLNSGLTFLGSPRHICRTNATYNNQSHLLVLNSHMPSLVIWAVSQHMFIATLWTAGYLPTFGTFSKTLLECNLLVTLKLFVGWSNVRFLKFVVKHHNLSVTIGYKNLYPKGNSLWNHPGEAPLRLGFQRNSVYRVVSP